MWRAHPSFWRPSFPSCFRITLLRLPFWIGWAFFFKLLFDFYQPHGLSKESGLSVGVGAPAWGSGEGLKERVQDFRHPWRSGMGLASLEGWWSLKHTDGMQDFQGMDVRKYSLFRMIITPMVLIDSLKVYEIIGPRISAFDFVPSRLHDVFTYTWVGSIYVATGTLWEPRNASWNEKRSSVQQLF